ncbi:class B sortase [Clostridium swellfunianum]|uniref:class B sortase n=1 Tax=Clostridium swellfunianum TaxID=1367462 RepID=UPI00203060A8|nr:class B sortase [Clostridium swellfunianum]MCM0647301.1 class B sortase [Clostridium swellfunianum]
MNKYFHKISLTLCLSIFIFSAYKISSYLYTNYKSKAAYEELKSIHQQASLPADNSESTSTEQIGQELNEDNFIEYLKEQARLKIYAQQKKQFQEEQEKKQRQQTFENLQKKNKDIVAWIYIPLTNIDYPIVKGSDNEFYLNHDALKKYSDAGAIFLDYNNKLGKDAKTSDKNLTIYGHHMKNGTMFKDLSKFRSKDFLSDNKFIYLDTKYRKETWEIFSVYITPADFNYRQPNFTSTKEYTNFLKSIKSKSIYSTNVQVSANDSILTLSTCSYEFEDARLVVQARLVKEQ